MSDDRDENVIKRLRLLRKLFGENQSQFAERIGISMKTWNHYERGIPVSKETAFKIKKNVKGITLDWIFLGDESGMPWELLQKLHELAREKDDDE